MQPTFLFWRCVLIIHAICSAVKAFHHPGRSYGLEQRTKTRFLATPSSKNADNSKARTLYDVLGAKGDESRAELKKLYVGLAKETHPDAQLTTTNNNNTNNTSSSSGQLDFSEIAAAWQILGDERSRKQYDRSLSAEQFSHDVVSWATEIGAPAAVDSFERVVLPFVRRATATTLAGVQAGLKDQQQQQGNKNKKTDLGTTLQKAMSAASMASKAIDNMEALERADKLDRQSAMNRAKAQEAVEQIQKVEHQRIRLVLHTPHSGLTSSDAAVVLSDFNQTVPDKRDGFLVFYKNSIHEDIQELTAAEQDYLQRQAQDQAAQQEYKATVKAQYRVKSHVSELQQQEAALLQQLEAVRAQLTDAKRNMTQSDAELSKAAWHAERSSMELERQSAALGKQSEKVRKALWQREREVLSALSSSSNQDQSGSEETMIMMEAATALPDEESDERRQEIEQLRAKARSMAQESVDLGESAVRLQERARQLRESANNKKQ